MGILGNMLHALADGAGGYTVGDALSGRQAPKVKPRAKAQAQPQAQGDKPKFKLDPKSPTGWAPQVGKVENKGFFYDNDQDKVFYRNPSGKVAEANKSVSDLASNPHHRVLGHGGMRTTTGNLQGNMLGSSAFLNSGMRGPNVVPTTPPVSNVDWQGYLNSPEFRNLTPEQRNFIMSGGYQ